MVALKNNISRNSNYICKSKINSLLLNKLDLNNFLVKDLKFAFDSCPFVMEQIGSPYDLCKRKFVKFVKLADLKTAVLRLNN